MKTLIVVKCLGQVHLPTKMVQVNYYHGLSICGFRVNKNVVNNIFGLLLQSISINEVVIDLFREIMLGQIKLNSGDIGNQKNLLESKISDLNISINNTDDLLVDGEMPIEVHIRVTNKYQLRMVEID